MNVEAFIYKEKIYSHPRLGEKALDSVVKGARTATCARRCSRIIVKAAWGSGQHALVLTRPWLFGGNTTARSAYESY